VEEKTPNEMEMATKKNEEGKKEKKEEIVERIR